jgi:ESCRT-I complex subunit VPS28
MDALRLRLRAKDQLHPILQELVTGYARFKGSKDWEGRSRMVGWYVLLSIFVFADPPDIQANHAKWHESFRRDHRRTIEAGTYSNFFPSLCIIGRVDPQLLFDVDHAYAEFFRSLGGGKEDRS